MSARRITALAISMVLGTTTAFAQTPSASAPMPAPSSLPKPLASASASASGSATVAAPPSSASSTNVPPGHPAVPPGHPSMDPDEDPQLAKIPQDQSHEDGTLPAGTIVARIVDEADKPLPNVTVTLGILRTSVPEGEARSSTTANTDANGVVRFSDLKRGTGWAYRVTVVGVGASGDVFATYGVPPFQLTLDKGHSVVLHRFPVSGSLEGLMAAVEGVDTIIELRDDVVEVQQLFDVINMSTTTWSLGQGLSLKLPPTFKALRAPDSMEDHTITAIDGVGVKWGGAFPPGQSRITYDFKVPYEGEPSVDMEIELPPRVLAARVRIASRKGMQLEVEGFPPAKEETTALGVKVLSTLKQGNPQDVVRSLRIHVRGIPVLGPERWIAIGAGLVAIACGIAFVFLLPEPTDKRATAAARKRRRKRAVDDLLDLERAHRSGDVGPKAYARERAKLVDIIASTLELVDDSDQADKKLKQPPKNVRRRQQAER